MLALGRQQEVGLDHRGCRRDANEDRRAHSRRSSGIATVISDDATRQYCNGEPPVMSTHEMSVGIC